MGSIKKQRIRCETECLQELRMRINGTQNLEKFSDFLDDKFLIQFIRGKKYDCDKAFETLENYFRIRSTKYSELFRTLRPSTTTSLNNGVLQLLNTRDHLNRPIAVCQSQNWDPSKDSIDDIINLFVLCADQLIANNLASNGLVLIFDFGAYSFKHARHLTPGKILKGINICINALPLQYKGFHFVNEMYLFTLMFKAVIPFLPKKLRERLFLHGNDMSSLHDHISSDNLPKFLGGTIPDDEAFDFKFEKQIRNRENYYRDFAELL